MTPQDAITILENASKFVKEIGSKSSADSLLEVVKVIQDLDRQLFVRIERHLEAHEQHCKHVQSLEKKIYDLQDELKATLERNIK